VEFVDAFNEAENVASRLGVRDESLSIYDPMQGLNCQKISGGLTSAYSLSLPLHTGDSASLTTAGG
jgi:hypothetical protein